MTAARAYGVKNLTPGSSDGEDRPGRRLGLSSGPVNECPFPDQPLARDIERGERFSSTVFCRPATCCSDRV